jgi:hypothetical protein
MLLVWDVKKTLLKGDTVFAEPKTGTFVFINGACVPLLRSPAQQRAARQPTSIDVQQTVGDSNACNSVMRFSCRRVKG